MSAGYGCARTRILTSKDRQGHDAMIKLGVRWPEIRATHTGAKEFSTQDIRPDGRLSTLSRDEAGI